MWTDEEKEFLKEITPGRHYKEIYEIMNKKYGFSYGQVVSAVKRYKLHTGVGWRFPKGHIPFNKGTKGLTKANKTSFKKGHIPKNKKLLGSERIGSEGYTLIKIAEPNVYKLKHRVIYEQHHGKIPKNHTVVFADGNKSNFDIDNLILVSRSELAMMNQHKLIKTDKELSKAGVNLARLLLKISEKNKK